MRVFALVSLLLLSLPAAAGTSLDAFDAHAGGIKVAAASSVPLVHVGGDVRTFVRINVSATRQALFLVDVGNPQIELSADLAKELKLKVKSGNHKFLNLTGKDNGFKLGGEVKNSTLPSLKLGEASLSDVAVVVRDDLGKVKGLPIEGVLGLSTFSSDLAWALLPSQGVLTVAPASQGAALVSAVGTAIPFKSFPREHVKGTVRKYKLNALTDPYLLVVPGSVNGSTVAVALRSGSSDCTLAASLNLGGAPVMPNGDQPKVWTSVGISDLPTHDLWWTRDGSLDMALVPHDVQAVACTPELFGVDLAIDPVAHTVALKGGGGNGGASIQGDLIAVAKAKASGEGAPTPAPAAAPKDKSPAKKDPGPLNALASAQAGAGDYDGAIASWQAVLAIDDSGCDSWQGLGEAQLKADHASDAATSFAKASELYHAWWDLSAEKRDDLAKQIGKLKTDDAKKKFGHFKQPSACFTADGELASAYLALGQVSNVQDVFARHLDLDPNLALARGLAALVAHDDTGAQGPLREALRREVTGSPEALPRLALAEINARAGNWAAAAPLFQRALEIDDLDPMAVHLYLDALNAAQGPAAALTAASAWADARPDSLAAQVGLLRQAQIAGDGRAQDMATQRIEVLRKRPYWREKGADHQAILARYLELIGHGAEAQQAANDALAKDPANPLAALVLSDLAAAAGDPKMADAWLARAARLGVMHPAYAILLGQLQPAPQGG